LKVSNLALEFREENGTPRATQNITGTRGFRIDGRTTCHPTYAVSLLIRKRIEEIFGAAWLGPSTPSSSASPPKTWCGWQATDIPAAPSWCVYTAALSWLHALRSTYDLTPGRPILRARRFLH
jgi:hypothetical protein